MRVRVCGMDLFCLRVRIRGLEVVHACVFVSDMLRGGFFFVSRFLGVLYAAGSKKKSKKKPTEHERVQFWGTTEHERGAFHARHMAKHTLNTRVCSFGYQ